MAAANPNRGYCVSFGRQEYEKRKDSEDRRTDAKGTKG